MIDVARTSRRRTRRGPPLLPVLALASVASLAAWSASAAEPAVREANFRVGGDYEYLHVFADDVFQFVPGPTTLTSAAEIDIDSGGFTGTYSFPLLVESLGARVYGGPRFGKTHADTFEETTLHGLDLGGEVFLRNPELGEAGFGTFYTYFDTKTGKVDRSEHTAGVEAFGKLFFGDRDSGTPIDIDIRMSFSDSNIDDNGSFSADRTYSTIGGVTAYFHPRAAVRLGAVYARRNLGTNEFLETRAATIDLDVLLPTERNVILGGGFIVGKREEAPAGFQNFGRMIFGIRLEATVSFTGAESLVELRRTLF